MGGAALTVARWLLYASVAGMLLLTFVWPFALSSDPADPRFKVAALALFVVFLCALAALAAARLKRS